LWHGTTTRDGLIQVADDRWLSQAEIDHLLARMKQAEREQGRPWAEVKAYLERRYGK